MELKFNVEDKVSFLSSENLIFVGKINKIEVLHKNIIKYRVEYNSTIHDETPTAYTEPSSDFISENDIVGIVKKEYTKKELDKIQGLIQEYEEKTEIFFEIEYEVLKTKIKDVK